MLHQLRTRIGYRLLDTGIRREWPWLQRLGLRACPYWPDPLCEYCYHTGVRYWHSEDCTDDLCALNGDWHSCRGQIEPCPCLFG